MNLKLPIYLLGFYLIFFTSTSYVSAHVLSKSGSIGAIIHLDPDDDPIAGESTNIYFDIKDNEGQLVNGCLCYIEYLQGGTLINRELLFTHPESGKFDHVQKTFVFPKPDVYQIKLVGDLPIADSTGNNQLNLSYDIRVSRSKNVEETKSNNYTGYIFLGLFIIITIIFIVAFLRRSRSN